MICPCRFPAANNTSLPFIELLRLQYIAPTPPTRGVSGKGKFSKTFVLKQEAVP